MEREALVVMCSYERFGFGAVGKPAYVDCTEPFRSVSTELPQHLLGMAHFERCSRSQSAKRSLYWAPEVCTAQKYTRTRTSG